ncbi:MAG TPA: hypothetical protein VF017_17525 [Thermoanaerobaculia bacterium]|nr:hypothetical protein [Thermoanaerobaculia bacterium]
MTDVFGHVTQLVRDGTGQVDRIVAPFSQVTEVTIGASGYLDEVADPLGNAVAFTYTTDGLMTSMEDARSHSSTFTRDGAGRLIKDEDALGGFTALSRSEPEPGSGVTAVHEVTKSTAMGRETLHRTEQLIEGGVRTTVIGPDGLASVAQQNPDGSRTTSYPDGTAVTLTTAPDPRLGRSRPSPPRPPRPRPEA